MKVIFLDVDGVLNSEKDLLEAKGKSELFDRPLALLKELVESTKAKIVVSSTWRIGCSKSGRNSWYGEEIFKTLTDRLAVRFANKYNLALKEFPADWNNLNVLPCRVITNSYGSYNALAGHKRNRDMAVYASSDDAFGVLVLFWDGKSKGSKNMKSQAVAFGLEIYENIINRQ